MIIVTKKGLIINIDTHVQIRGGKGVIGISLDDNDSVIGTMDYPKTRINVATKNGMVITFMESDIRKQKRGGRGVKAIRLHDNDEVVSIS